MKSHYYTKKATDLKETPKTFTYHINKMPFVFKTNSGVFSKDYVDFGTMTLLENFIEPAIEGNFLDVGCGYGAIGIYLAKIYPKRDVCLVDINERAVLLAKENIELNATANAVAFNSDLYQEVKGKYAAIISNPPIRAGKKVIYKLYEQAKDFLLVNGELWIVIQKKQGALSTLAFLQTLYRCEIVCRSKGYYILRCINIDI